MIRVQGPVQVLGHEFSSGSAETKKESRIENAHCAERKNLKEESNIHFLELEPPPIDREPTGIISNCAHSLLLARPETASVCGTIEMITATTENLNSERKRKPGWDIISTSVTRTQVRHAPRTTPTLCEIKDSPFEGNEVTRVHIRSQDDLLLHALPTPGRSRTTPEKVTFVICEAVGPYPLQDRLGVPPLWIDLQHPKVSHERAKFRNDPEDDPRLNR